MTTIQRLTEMLNQKDAEIEELQEKVQEYEDASEREWKWSIHEKLKDGGGLPVPRLEIRAKPIDGDWANYEWHYSLIYRHLLKDIIRVPLGLIRCNGSSGRPPVYDGKISGPFRDGVHLMHDSGQLNLPAFLIVETDPPVIQKEERQLNKSTT